MAPFSFNLMAPTQPNVPPARQEAAELPDSDRDLDKLRKDYVELARLHSDLAAQNYQLQSENHALRAQLKESEVLQKNYQQQIDDAHFEVARLERVIREADMDPVDADRVESLQQLEEGRKARR